VTTPAHTSRPFSPAGKRSAPPAEDVSGVRPSPSHFFCAHPRGQPPYHAIIEAPEWWMWPVNGRELRPDGSAPAHGSDLFARRPEKQARSEDRGRPPCLDLLRRGRPRNAVVGSPAVVGVPQCRGRRPMRHSAPSRPRVSATPLRHVLGSRHFPPRPSMTNVTSTGSDPRHLPLSSRSRQTPSTRSSTWPWGVVRRRPAPKRFAFGRRRVSRKSALKLPDVCHRFERVDRLHVHSPVEDPRRWR